jgi:hypothetical protein
LELGVGTGGWNWELEGGVDLINSSRNFFMRPAIFYAIVAGLSICVAVNVALLPSAEPLAQSPVQPEGHSFVLRFGADTP